MKVLWCPTPAKIFPKQKYKTKKQKKNKRFKVFGPQEEFRVQFVTDWSADISYNGGCKTLSYRDCKQVYSV